MFLWDVVKNVPVCYAVTEDEEWLAECALQSFTASLSWCRRPGWIFKARWIYTDAFSCMESLQLSALYSYTFVCLKLKAKRSPKSKTISRRKTLNKLKYQTQSNNKIIHHRVLTCCVYTQQKRSGHKCTANIFLTSPTNISIIMQYLYYITTNDKFSLQDAILYYNITYYYCVHNTLIIY